VFDAFDTVDACLEVLAGAIATARFDPERMRAALREGFIDATEMADYLVTRGVPFRQAHHIVGRLVRYAQERGKSLAELSLAELQAEYAAFSQDVFRALDPEIAVERRDLVGGPARAKVQTELAALRERLERWRVDVDQVAKTFGADQWA
jgi:argininosuccinate lyase